MQTNRILIVSAVLFGIVFLFYMALPTLIALSFNTLYLGGFLIVLGIVFYGLYRLFKWAFSKS